ncbi:chromosome segregation protein SMC [soil metagenome]
MLSAIYIKGFKTFAQPVRMPLTGGITAIVGPNGSGKSNVTDAVLFALGEGSPSLLRAGSMSELIFSGSERLPAAGAAEVTLVLDNADGGISLPYEEVSLARRVSRDGETEYRINGVRARLADVRAVAGEAGLGRHSILRQGAVDSIVSGGAAACRIALEEAAGLGVFRRRRVAAARKLERAAARLESSRQLEAELSDQLRRIETEAVAAREYRELEARYRELSLVHLYRVATRGLDEGRERLRGLEEKEEALRARREALQEEGLRSGAEEKELEYRVREAEEAIRGLENGSEALRVEALRAERASLRLEGVRGRGADRSNLIQRLQAELEEAGSKVRRLEEMVESLEREHSRRKEALGQLEECVARGRKEHAGAAGRRARLSEELEGLRERRERMAGRLWGWNSSSDEDLARLREMGRELAMLAPEESRARAAAVLGRLGDLREAVAERVAEADRRRGAVSALVGRTEAEVRALRASGQNGSGVKRLYEILRPLPGYEAAVEAALGELAGGVLVENIGEGLEFLSGDSSERVIVRLDAEATSGNGVSPGKSLLECVEVLDGSYAEAIERLLGGAYVVEGGDRATPKSGYDVAVTREGLRFTRTSASRHAPGALARQACLTVEEERLGALKNRIGEDLYDLREAVASASRRLEGANARAEALSSAMARTPRVARLLASEVGRRVRKVETARERRSREEKELRDVEARGLASEKELREARGEEGRTKEELNVALSGAESAYADARESAGDLARARTNLGSAREGQSRVSRGLAVLEGAATSADAEACMTSLTRMAVEHARRLDAAARGRIVRLRRLRSEAAGERSRVAERRSTLTGEAGGIAGELARAESETVTLRGDIFRAEEAAKAAETEIREEWGATLEGARGAAGDLPEGSDAERGRLARRLKSFGDVNLLAISQEGQLRERHEFGSAQRADAEAAAEDIARIIRDVDGEIEARFEATFRGIRRAFKDMVPRMMEGAEGELTLSEEGVEIGLRLKSRGWRPLRVLSGGERSLLALSFLFGIFLGRVEAGPRAFCMLDEAEAALDDLNLSRFLAVIDSYRADGQFLLVTHQKRTMAAADVLYGATQDSSGATIVVSKRLTGV